MTIRYTCVKCGSVLKIQDDRVGREKHCPKCKTSFIVPPPGEADAGTDSVDDELPAEAAPAKPAPAAAEKVAAAKTKSPAAAAPAADADAGDADFDPVAFLMTEGGGGAVDKSPGKRAVAAASEQPDLKAARGGPAAYVASEEPDIRVGGPRQPARGDDDDSATELRNRKPKRAPTPSAAQTADEMLRVNASTNAKELLTKTMEESRIRAAQMPEERKAPGIDYMEAVRELGLRFAPAVGGAVLLIVLAYWLGNLMMGGPDLPPLARVSGIVTKNGQPIADAYVSFSPVDTKAGAGTAYTDEKGFYDLKYTEGVKGAVVGKNRIEVSKLGPDGREMVPAKTMYGQGSNVIQVVEQGSQTVDIAIP